MAVIPEIIRLEENGTLSFGNYELESKTKVLDFEVESRFYKAKTFKEVTKLKRDGELVYESLPGTAVHEFSVNDTAVRFSVEGTGTTQITLEVQPSTEYKLIVDDMVVDNVKTNLSGKVSFSVDATHTAKEIILKKLV